MKAAPKMNSFNALNGDVAGRPTKLFQALSEADAYCQELDGLRELETRVQELEVERDELVEELATARMERDVYRMYASFGGLS